MYHRERVEKIILSRLLSKDGDVRKVPDTEFNGLLTQLNFLLKYCSRERKIMGFTSDDLYSFLVLKLHQILRRDQFNEKLGKRQFFFKSFNNFLNDVERLKNRTIKKNFDKDAIDDCHSLWGI